MYYNNMIVMQKLHKICRIQLKRYQKKGLANCILAIILFLGIMTISRAVGEYLWPDHIANQMNFVFIGSFLCHMLFQIISFVIYLPAYMGWTKIYDNFLINKKSSRPWQRKNWPEVRTKAIKNLVINQLLVYPFLVYLSNASGVKVRFDNFPQFLQVLWQIIFVYFVQDFFFYWGHRLFHTYSFLYKMHKIHHQYDTLFTWVTEYFHPLDFAVANVLPSAVGFIILGNKVHCFTFFYWICWKVLISTEGHSGYEFPFSPMRILPLVTGPSYHDHHHSHNIGNYAGSCYLWDLVFDTNIEYMNDFLKSQ